MGVIIVYKPTYIWGAPSCGIVNGFLSVLEVIVMGDVGGVFDETENELLYFDPHPGVIISRFYLAFYPAMFSGICSAMSVWQMSWHSTWHPILCLSCIYSDILSGMACHTHLLHVGF